MYTTVTKHVSSPAWLLTTVEYYHEFDSKVTKFATYGCSKYDKKILNAIIAVRTLFTRWVRAVAHRERVVAHRERAVNTLQQLLARRRSVMNAIKTLWERRVYAVGTLWGRCVHAITGKFDI